MNFSQSTFGEVFSNIMRFSYKLKWNSKIKDQDLQVGSRRNSWNCKVSSVNNKIYDSYRNVIWRVILDVWQYFAPNWSKQVWMIKKKLVKVLARKCRVLITYMNWLWSIDLYIFFVKYECLISRQIKSRIIRNWLGHWWRFRSFSKFQPWWYWSYDFVC